MLQKTSELSYLLFYFLTIIFPLKWPWSFICTKLIFAPPMDATTHVCTNFVLNSPGGSGIFQSLITRTDRLRTTEMLS